VTLPAQVSAATAEQAAEQISVADRGGQARFAIRPGGPLHRITGFAGIHPLPAVYLTLQRAVKADYPSRRAIAHRPGGRDHLITI
jgi:hypothetical protein